MLPLLADCWIVVSMVVAHCHVTCCSKYSIKYSQSLCSFIYNIGAVSFCIVVYGGCASNINTTAFHLFYVDKPSSFSTCASSLSCRCVEFLSFPILTPKRNGNTRPNNTLSLFFVYFFLFFLQFSLAHWHRIK